MKKLLTILILLLAVASQGRADNPEIVIWEGNERISWNQEVYAGSQYELIPAIDLKKDDIIKITTTKGIDEPQYVLTYKAGDGWEWTNLAITTDNDIMSYTVASDQIATEIKRGLIFRGQGYNITKVSVIRPLTAESGATVDGNKISISTISSTFAGAYLNIGGLTGKKRLLATFAKEQEVEIIAEHSDNNNKSYTYITKGTNSDTDGDYTVALGLDDSKTLSKIYFRKVSAGDITLKSVAFDTEEVSSNGALYNDDGTINLLKIAPQNIDETAYNVNNFKITSAAAWKAVQLWLNENDNVKGDMLTIKLASTLSVELNVSYYGTDTQGPSISLTPGDTPAEVNLPLDGNKTINKIEIKSSAANQEITLSEISIASAKEVFKPNETLTLVASTETNRQSVSYYKFGNASSGDKILVYVAGSDVSMDMKAGGDNPLRGHTWDASKTSSISESSSVQRVFVYELTEGNRLNYIKDHGFYIEATSGSCTLDKIMLVSAGDIPTSEPNIFDGNGKADISRASTDGEGTYVFSSTGLNIAASAGKGITLNTVTGETVNRKELAISLDKAIPVTVQYTIGGESKTAILNAKDINLTLDENKALTQVSIKPVNATTGDGGSVTVKNVAVSSTSSASTASNKDELWAGSRAITEEYGIPFNYKYDRLAAGDVIRVTYSGDGDLNAAISYSTDGSAKTSISSLIADLEAKTLEFAVTSDMLEAIKTYGLYVSGNLTLSKVERITASTIPAESALADGETIVLWKSQAGEAIDYSVLFTVGSALAGIIEKNEQILVSVSSIETGAGKYNKVWACSLSDTNNQLITEQHLENASGTLALAITADKLESLRSGFGIAADDMTITEVSLRKPRLIDSFTGYTNDEEHTMTAKRWNGGITLDYGTDSDESAAYLTVETSENSVLKHEITFTDGWVYEHIDSEATTSRTIALDGTKKIQKIFLQNANSENESTEGTVTFSNIALSSTTSGSAVTPSTKKALTNTASITEVNTKAGRLVVKLTDALATTVKIGYDDGTVVLYPVNNTANRNLALDATKTISTIDIVKADDSETALAISEIYLQMTSVEGDEAAITKPTADTTTALFAPSSGVAMNDNKICLVGDVYVTKLLEAGQEMNVTLDKSTTPVLKLLNKAGEEVKSLDLENLQGNIARIPVTTTILTSIANGFSLSGSDITISKVEIFKPATQTAPTTENSLTLYNNESPEMTGYADICYVNSGYGAVFEEDMELRITVTEISSGSSDYRKVLIHDANSTEQLGAGFAEVNAAGDVVFTLTAIDVEAMKNGFCVLAQNIKVSKIVLAKTTKTEKTLKEMSEAVAIGNGDITINHGLFANAEVGDVIRIYGGSFGAEPKVAIKIGETENCLDGAGWKSFTSSPFSLTLTESVLAVVKAQDIRISGQDYSFSKAILLTSQNLGGNIYKLTTEATNGSITVKKGTEETTDTEFASGTGLTFIAEPADNFTFKKWQKDGVDIEGATTATLTTSITTDMTITAVFQPTSLENEERRTLWVSGNADGDALNWEWSTGAAMMPSAISSILEPGEQFIYTIKVTGDNPSVRIDKLAGGEVANTGLSLVDGENRLSLTAAMITEMADGFKLNGQGASITKLELYKPTPITALAEEDTKTLWSNASGEALAEWNTITIDRNSEWGAILEEDERIIISVKAKDANCEWPTVALSNSDGSINSTSNLLNDLTMPTELTITLTAEMVNKMKNGFNITGDGATITKAVLYKPTMPTKTVHTLNSTETAISGDTNVTVAAEKFANIAAYDVLTVNFTITTSPANVIIKGNGEDGGWDYLKEMKFENGETLFALPLTPAMTSNLKKNGLQITGSGYTFKSVTIKTAGEVPSDEEKKDDEKKGDEEAVIDKKTGEADLNELSAQDDTKTTLTQNEDGSITMTTTEAYQAAQIWFNDPEVVAGNVLKVQLAESSVNVTVTVKYTDGTQSQMSANTMAAKARGAVRAATRADSGTEIEVPLETGKEVQNIEVKNNVAGTITIQKMQVTTINVFTNGVANLSMLKPQSNATYDTSTHTLATTKGWTGATISPVDGEKVSGKELLIEFAEAAKVKVAVKYRTDVEGPSIIMEKAAANVRLALDNTKSIQEISIQPTDAAIVTFTKIAVNGEESDDGKLKPGKSITLWENSAGEKLAWNEVAKQGEDIGEMLQEYDELLITVSGVAEDCDWPKVFLRDANSEQAGNEVLLNDVASFPYTVRIVLTGDMAEQLANGFCVCGDGITVTKLVAYRPEEPKEGDIHLADLNYGYNSSYDKGTHTITTTSRWAARGWEIGDKRYNDKNLIIVKFEPVDFPVTLKMEYTTGVQTAQATSVGVPAGRTELMLEIPQGISKLNRVYLIYEEPGSLRLTEASVVYQDKLKLSTAIQAFEAEGVIRDGRYDTDGWYNLRGMRIQEPKTSGVYIHGGKKVVIY